MRPATIVLGLISAGVAISLATMICGNGSLTQAPGSVQMPAQARDSHGTEASDASERTSEQAASSEQSSGANRQSPGTEHLSEPEKIPPQSHAGEEETAKWVREDAIRDVPKRYSLIIERLDLTPSEKEALLEVLIEAWMASARTAYAGGEGLDERERLERIAAILGPTKLQQFVALERNVQQHAEVLYMDDVLNASEVPMTAAQRNQMLEILNDIQVQGLSVPGADAERGSMEQLESRLARMDERERLVFEQAASILSAEQLGYLFDWYQHDSYRRADALERQKKARADGRMGDLPPYYPARTDPVGQP